jgi:putative peptide zinc metalloprotease protein
MPNLRQKSSAVVQRKLGAWLLGLRERPDPFLPSRHRWAFAIYAVAASIYGWLVSLSIFWFLYRVLEPYGLKIIGQLLAAAMVSTLIVVPLVRLTYFLFQPARSQHMKPLRAIVGLGSAAAVAAGVLAVPLPYYVACSLEVQPRGAANVFVDVPGQVQQVHVRSGPVAAGQPIAQLDDLEVRLARQRLAAQRDGLAARIESIRQRAHTDDRALLELSQTEEALAALDVQLAKRSRELDRLLITAPATGLLIPPPSRKEPSADKRTLAAWSGRPLDLHNVGAHLEASTLIGRIAQPGRWEAILAIGQDEMDYVRAGQRVDLLLNSLPGWKFTGRIEHVAEQEMQAVSARLTARGGGDLATRTTDEGIEKPLDVVYQASVPLDDPSGRIVAGAAGRAKIHAGYQTLAGRIWRALCRTFRFEM